MKIIIKEDVINREYVCFIKPNYIYLPFDERIKNNTYIYKDDLIGNEYSPVSGFVRKTIILGDNKDKYFIVENDFKDRKRRNSVKYLPDNSLINIDKNIKYLIVNAIDTEPYVYVRRTLVKKMSSGILDIVDYIMEKYSIQRTIIAISDDYSYDMLNTYIGTYPKIKIIKVNNYYPVSNNNILLKELSIKKKNNIVNIEHLIDIYKIINNRTFNDTVLITIGGNILKKSINIIVKKGTLLKDVLSFLECKEKDYSLMRGGPLLGKIIKDANIVITENDYAFMLYKNNNPKEEECTLCGRCMDVCPQKLIPMFIMNNVNNQEGLKKLNINKCIDCGLCSYICPARINLRSYIDKAKDLVRNE